MWDEPGGRHRGGHRGRCRCVGREAQLGAIVVGKRADFLAVAGDPVQDLRALRASPWSARVWSGDSNGREPGAAPA